MGANTGYADILSGLGRRGRRGASLLISQSPNDAGAIVWCDFYFDAAGASGNATVLLDALSSTGSGQLVLLASATQTLGQITQSASAVLTIQANGSVTLGSLTSTGTAEIASQSNVGLVVSSFGELAQNANGYLSIKASSVDGALGEIQPSSTAALTILGAASLRLGSLQSNGHGAEIVTAGTRRGRYSTHATRGMASNIVTRPMAVSLSRQASFNGVRKNTQTRVR